MLPSGCTARSPTVRLCWCTARGLGKTTPVRTVAEEAGLHCITLDDLTILAAARDDAAGFIAGFA